MNLFLVIYEFNVVLQRDPQKLHYVIQYQNIKLPVIINTMEDIRFEITSTLCSCEVRKRTFTHTISQISIS